MKNWSWDYLTLKENTHPIFIEWRDLICETKNGVGPDQISEQPATCSIALREAESDTKRRIAEKNAGCFEVDFLFYYKDKENIERYKIFTECQILCCVGKSQFFFKEIFRLKSFLGSCERYYKNLLWSIMSWSRYGLFN